MKHPVLPGLLVRPISLERRCSEDSVHEPTVTLHSLMASLSHQPLSAVARDLPSCHLTRYSTCPCSLDVASTFALTPVVIHSPQ